MNKENIKDRIYKLDRELKSLASEVAMSSGTFTGDEIDELVMKMNSIRSSSEYLSAAIKGKREIVLHG